MLTHLKILHTPARFFPSIGGVERYVFDLAQEQSRQGHQVTVVCANEPVSAPMENIDGVSVIRLPYKRKLSNTNITHSLLKVIMKLDVDIIHTHIPTPWSADISALTSLARDKPLIVTYHNDILKTSGPEKILCDLYNSTLLRLVLRTADGIIVTQDRYLEYSRYLKKYRHKVSTISAGVRSPRIVGDVPRKTNQVFFLSVLDQYHEYKGLAVLLEAMALIRVQRPYVKLVVGGGGALVGKYKMLARELGIESSVIFLGFVSEVALPRIFRESAIFVLPSVSHLEGFGIVALEALSYATPVVTTAITGVSTFIEGHGAGLVVQPSDRLGLAEAITSLLSEPSKAVDMGARGAEAVVTEFGWGSVSSQVLALYDRVLNCAS